LGAASLPKTTPKYATILVGNMEDQHAPEIFGQWLKLRRKTLDLTQDELAQRVGCSLGALRKIEGGDRRPSKQLAGLLAKSLNIADTEQATFVRVARGELNLERLGRASDGTGSDNADGVQIQQTSLVASGEERSNLPTSRIPLQASPIIGRDNEYASLERLFDNQHCRLVTLTGIGGIGKTRLAIEFALIKQSAFPGGVFYFPLTSVKAPEEVVPAIAEILDYVFSGPAAPKEQLFNFISNNIKGRALFIFDNLEHLLAHNSQDIEKPGLADLVCEMLERLPMVTILGTSRERLNIHGEWTYELHGLSIPPTNFSGSLEEFDSAALFINSAKRIRSNYQPGIEEKPYLVNICQLVEGVPLAIELAAAWAGMLTCQEIAQEIKMNMDFLSTSMRNIPTRHRSIRATFEHSWKLLSEEERQALCKLSVFHGGFDRKAALQIAGAPLPLLASLCDKSLVHPIDGRRYDLHEVIRQYALSHLDDHPFNINAYERHCEYYLTLVASHEKSLKSAVQQEAMRELTDEIDNIRAAWAWAIKNEKFTQLEQAGRAYGWYYEIAGLLQEGIEQLELLVQALKGMPTDCQRQRILGLALLHQALLTFRTGEFSRAQKLYEKSIEILRPTGDKALLADGMTYLAIIQHLSGNYEQAELSVREGLTYARLSQDRWIEAYAIYNLGYLESIKGNFNEGYEQMMAGLAIWREIGDPFSIALGLNFMVYTLIEVGRFEEANDAMLESIHLCEQTKNRWGIGTAYRYLGLVKMAEGKYEQAEAHFRKSLEIFSDYTTGWDIARSLVYLGDVLRLSGQTSEARKNYLDALNMSVQASSIPIALGAIAGLSHLQAQVGDSAIALELGYYILKHPSTEEETKTEVERQRKDLEQQLDNNQIRLLQNQSMKATFEEIVQMASRTG
jgi:predicted ATPase/transcriptional regulator with XRE-family HTH domain